MTGETAEGVEEPRADADDELESLLRKVADVDGNLGALPLPQPGQTVADRYRIEAHLGSGGMGVVFRATHLISGRPVALKWMRASTADARARRRFLREARAAGRIDHPNVVSVHDVGEQKNCGYLVMELLHGATLRQKLRHAPLPVGEMLGLLLPAMRGVAAVHRAGVIHRDLKPDNIFLCRGVDGSAREAKVLDFGVADLRVDLDGPTLTREGALIGTPAYMAPEQIQNARDADERSDIYSFGVILYEALTGRVPFKADSYASILFAIVHEAPKPLAMFRSDLPEGLEQIVLRALAKHSSDRFASIEGLIDALTPFANVDAPELAASNAWTAAQRRKRVRRLALTLSAVACVLLLTVSFLIADSGTRHGARHMPSLPGAAAQVAVISGLGAAAPYATDISGTAAVEQATANDAHVESAKPAVPPKPVVRARKKQRMQRQAAPPGRSGIVTLDDM
jgi:serine/threonine protein kinase